MPSKGSLAEWDGKPTIPQDDTPEEKRLANDIANDENVAQLRTMNEQFEPDDFNLIVGLDRLIRDKRRFNWGDTNYLNEINQAMEMAHEAGVLSEARWSSFHTAAHLSVSIFNPAALSASLQHCKGFKSRRDAIHRTPLHIAAFKDRYSMIKQTVSGSGLIQPDRFGRIPSQIAEHKGSKRFLAALQKLCREIVERGGIEVRVIENVKEAFRIHPALRDGDWR